MMEKIYSGMIVLMSIMCIGTLCIIIFQFLRNSRLEDELEKREVELGDIDAENKANEARANASEQTIQEQNDRIRDLIRDINRKASGGGKNPNGQGG